MCDLEPFSEIQSHIGICIVNIMAEYMTNVRRLTHSNRAVINKASHGYL